MFIKLGSFELSLKVPYGGANMTGKLHRETLYRGEKAIRDLSKAHVALCGLGAIGSNLAVLLARSGVTQLTLIDFDRVEESNIGTQAYSLEDVGALKSDALAHALSRECGVYARFLHGKLTEKSDLKRTFNDVELVIDCFDNSDSRRLLYKYSSKELKEWGGPNCLHVGLDTEYGEIRWNEQYIVPSDPINPGAVAPCDIPLARTLIHLTVGIAGESIIRFLTQGVRESYSLTLRDLKISRD